MTIETVFSQVLKIYAMLTWSTLALLGISFVVLYTTLKLTKGLQAVSHLAGLRVAFGPLVLPGVMLPTTSWNPGLAFTWWQRFQVYKRFNSETFSVVPFVWGLPVIYTSNLDVARQVTATMAKTGFIKPPEAQRTLTFWGMNLAASEGHVWRNHRRIMSQAFNSSLYQMIWAETLHAYQDMLTSEKWAGRDVVILGHAHEVTFHLALLMIGKFGFGLTHLDWLSPVTMPDGSKSVLEVLRAVIDTNIFSALSPQWLLDLPFKKLKEIKEMHSKLHEFMVSQISDRKEEIRGQDVSHGRKDVFSMLVRANEDEEAKHRLDDSELVGNVFLLLFAGHESTGNSLSSTFALLAAHQDIQDEIREHIRTVIGDDMNPSFEHYPKLFKVVGALYEALRMYPAGYMMIREAIEDTSIEIPNPIGQEGTRTIPVPKGVQVVVDMVGLHYNKRYYEEPKTFKPSRWYDTAPESESITPFGLGPRVCLGRKFSMTESVAFLTMLLRDWRIEPSLAEGESASEWGKRILEDATMFASLGPTNVPVRMVRLV